MQGWPGNIHHHGPFGNGTGDHHLVLSGLPGLCQQPESGVLNDAVIGKQFQTLLQHKGRSGNFRHQVLKNADIFLHQGEQILPPEHHHGGWFCRHNITRVFPGG